MYSKHTITKDAVRVAREVVELGFWRRHETLSESAAADLVRTGTLWYADLGALEERIGRKLLKHDHWLWEKTLRAELRRLEPVASS